MRVRLLLAALYLSPGEADGIQAELQVLLCLRETHMLLLHTLHHVEFACACSSAPFHPSYSRLCNSNHPWMRWGSRRHNTLGMCQRAYSGLIAKTCYGTGPRHSEVLSIASATAATDEGPGCDVVRALGVAALEDKPEKPVLWHAF